MSKGTPIIELRIATFVRRYWKWDDRTGEYSRHEQRSEPKLQYRLSPGAAWHDVPVTDVLVENPPKPG